jgi:hypothetical protein
MQAPQSISGKPVTLWGALHNFIGGGYIHLVNTMLYTLESGGLSLNAPLLVRPTTRWKPNPVTETYRRTRKWKHYMPTTHKLAQAEYYEKQKRGELGDIQKLPMAWIELLLQTNEKEYQKLKASKPKDAAKIDLIKLLLGSNYLGEAQITYIQSMVKKAVVQYAQNSLPCIIVFDDLEAAVAMSLNEQGYAIERFVFRNGQNLLPDELTARQTQISATIAGINRLNQKLFEEKLRKYYQ